MTVRLRFTSKAEEDLADLHEEIRKRDPAAADKLVGQILRRIDLLSSFPRASRRRPEVDPTARTIAVAPYVILYDLHPDTDDGPVETASIQRVMHGHRAIGRMF